MTVAIQFAGEDAAEGALEDLLARYATVPVGGVMPVENGLGGLWRKWPSTNSENE